MDHPDMEEDECMSAPPDDRMGDMDQDDMMGGGGRDSPLKPSGGMDVGEDILAKLRHQVSSASIFGGHHNHTNNINSRDSGTNGTSAPGSPNAYSHAHHHNNNTIHNNGHNIYDRLQTLLQAKLKREDDGDMDDEAREMTYRAEEILLRQRDALLSSPHSLMSVMRGGPPSLVPPTSHLPFLPTSVGLPPSSQMPPTPGSAGSRDSSSGNGNRTPSHSPEPSQSQQPWSFEEQFKQVRPEDFGLTDPADSPRVREPAKHSSFEEDKRKLYELSNEVKRKEFLDELFAFMQKRGTPINRLPIMAKQVLDLYELYNLVVERGGLVDVINKKLWQEIIKGLKLPSSITSAAFTLRTQYMKYLYPFECEKKQFSNPAELQCAIDGNRREGRRSSYGTYGDMVQPPMLPLQNLQNFQNFQNLQNPLSLVSRPQINGNGGSHPLVPQDLLLGRGGSPPGSQEALLEATRITMWKWYNQHGLGGSGLGGGGGGGSNGLHDDDGPRHPPPHMPLGGPQPPQKEALNLDVKDDFGDSHLKDLSLLQQTAEPWLHGFPRPQNRNKDNSSGESRHSKSSDEGGNRPPSAKRPANQEDSQNQRLPTPNGATSVTLPGANIKITSRGDGRGQDQSLVVSMEINGILYQGVLFAQAPRARFS